MLTFRVDRHIKLTLLTIPISVLEKVAKAAKYSVKDLKKADEEEVKTIDNDLGTSVEKEMATSTTDLLVPVEKCGKDEAFVEGPTSSQLEPGKYIN